MAVPATPRNLIPAMLLISSLLAPAAAAGDEVRVAVSVNFSNVTKDIAQRFEAVTSHRVRIVSGSTGKLHAQITNGAPFDVLLAADQVRPALLEASGHGVPGSRFTYAVGQLCLWSANPDLLQGDLQTVLARPSVNKLAIANPALAPYGAAAKQVLQSLALWDSFERRIVMGENIGQTYALVATGNADLGFVALSSLIERGSTVPERRWCEWPGRHEPIRQDALLLQHGADNPAARAFVDYLGTPAATVIIRAAGYDTG